MDDIFVAVPILASSIVYCIAAFKYLQIVFGICGGIAVCTVVHHLLLAFWSHAPPAAYLGITLSVSLLSSVVCARYGARARLVVVPAACAIVVNFLVSVAMDIINYGDRSTGEDVGRMVAVVIGSTGLSKIKSVSKLKYTITSIAFVGSFLLIGCIEFFLVRFGVQSETHFYVLTFFGSNTNFERCWTCFAIYTSCWFALFVTLTLVYWKWNNIDIAASEQKLPVGPHHRKKRKLFQRVSFLRSVRMDFSIDEPDTNCALKLEDISNGHNEESDNNKEEDKHRDSKSLLARGRLTSVFSAEYDYFVPKPTLPQKNVHTMPQYTES
eukprot:433678_1